jgi:integrase
MANRDSGDKFPLWLNPNGQWCKKHRGKPYYFGTDKDAALKRYVQEWDDIVAGKVRRPKAEAVRLADAVNEFLNAKRLRVKSGELAGRTWAEYHRACETAVDTFGADRDIADLRPTDFATLRAKAAETLGPVALSKFITLVRSMFAYAYDAELIPAPVRYGEQFDKPPKRVIRLQRAANGEKLIPAADVWKLLNGADTQVRAMILLGINCGYGQKDCSDLQRRALETRPGWIEAPRAKTGIARRCPLWPETVEALAAVQAARPEPRNEDDSDCVFLTMFGNRWCRYRDKGPEKRGVALDAVAYEFRKLAKRVGVKVPGRGGPYTLRHTFRTVADEVKDQPAAGLIMGHADQDISSYYRESISNERLTAITDHVREWLMNAKPKPS